MNANHISSESKWPQQEKEKQGMALSAETISAIAVALADELERRGAVQPQHEFYSYRRVA